MATNFPGSVDSFPRPGPFTNTDDPGFELDVVIDNLSDAVEAVETDVLATRVQVDTYLPVGAAGSQSTYTWTKPAGAKEIRCQVAGAGGGGGSGRRGAAGTVRGGGGGGGCGQWNEGTFPASAVPAQLTVKVGKGGLGGAARTTDDTDGAPGTSGGESQIYPFGSTGGFPWSLLTGRLGTFGGGGTTVGGTAGSGGAAGAVGGVGGVGPAANQQSANTLTGGSGGGGLSAANAAEIGGRIFAPNVRHYFASANPAVGADGTTVLDPALIVTPYGDGSYGGCGGGAGLAAGGAAGSGGPAQYGSGGGGGGASLNGYTSGAGGSGGDGVVVISTYF